MYVYTNRQRCTTVWGRAQGPLHTAGLPHRLRKCNCRSSRGAAQWVIVYVHGQSRQRDQKHLRQGATGKATTEQRIQWGESTRVQMAHRRDEADESGGVPSTSMGTVEQADQLPWTQVGIAGSRNDGAILRRPCPCRASDAWRRLHWDTSWCEVTWCFLWATPSFSRHGSVEKIRRTKKNKHILI